MGRRNSPLTAHATACTAVTDRSGAPGTVWDAPGAGQLTMGRQGLVGLVAGLAGALLFASMASGSLLSFALFYLAPLPLMIAALGWCHLAGLIAAFVASACLAAAFGGWFFPGFLVGVGLPACWLAYLALLARPVGARSPDGLEWYPVGRLVIWSAVLGALIVALAIPTFGTDAESFRTGLKSAFDRLLDSGDNAGETPLLLPGFSDAQEQLDFLVAVVPPVAAVVSTVTSLTNLWLAAKVVKVSGRLKRPWPDLKAMELPRYGPILLAAGIAGSFLPDLLGTVASLFACTMLTAYALLGFAVLHATLIGVNGRGFMLAGIYALVAVFGWPALLMALVGLADVAIDIRGRVARKRGSTRSQT